MDLAQTLSTYLTTYSVGRDSVAYIARVSDDTWRVDHDTGPGLRLTLDDLSESRLHRVLDNLTVKARVLAGFVAAGASAAPATDDGSFIRV